ncbi:hypothetical protein BD626DRAFT_411343 [Schizophyllum amplum]|uniref:Fungal-type protein kinase domain-containing protein n=1 Tax=Schizophyllum amplum TaxID=97359 RepID=A0A550BZA6_9AGAR|nr:hypothetical protein BD626DRAFT_411343 [Auriculariopsis ampla]
MPRVVGKKEWAEYNTKTIREALGLSLRKRRLVENDESSDVPMFRVLRALTTDHLKPLHELDGKDFIVAWFECQEVHYLNWLNKVQHKDPSLSNLMYRIRPDGSICAVLNDWDLAVDASSPQTHTGFEVTGTVPFMAIDLLTDTAIQGQTRHLYRHDLESFIWILVWVVYCYDGGRKLDDTRMNPDLKAWNTGRYVACRKEKRDFAMQRPEPPTSTTSWKPEYRRMMKNLLYGVFEADACREFTRQRVIRGREVEREEVDEPERAWKEHWENVLDTIKDESGLEDLQALIPSHA